MNIEEQALSVFRTPPCHYNCAQAVCAALGRRDLLEAMQFCGGGKAPGGMCGALYAAVESCPPEKRSELSRHFVDKLGYSTCHALKKEGRIPCPVCVATAASLGALGLGFRA